MNDLPKKVHGFRVPVPAFTQTPNDLFDYWLPHLNESELKVLLVVMRKTFGWHLKEGRISLSEFIKTTGLSLSNVQNAVKSLQSRGILHKKVEGPNGIQQVWYELVMDQEEEEFKEIPTIPEQGEPPLPVPVLPPYLHQGPPIYRSKETAKETIKESTPKPPQKKSASSGRPVIAADACSSKIQDSQGKVLFINQSGNEDSISEEKVYKHLVGTGRKFPPDVIRRAIDRAQLSKSPTTNILSLIESICLRLENEDKIEREETKKIEDRRNYQPKPIDKSQFITWADLEKKRAERESSKNEK